MIGTGLKRSDLLKDNGKIFVEKGEVINDHAKRSFREVVMGNLANTNPMIAAHYAKDISRRISLLFVELKAINFLDQ